jgi:ubiquitin-protein ligase
MAPKLLDHTPILFRQDNPKRSGTKAFERYELYKSAKTVGEAIKLGAQRADVANDLKQGACALADSLQEALSDDQLDTAGSLSSEPALKKPRIDAEVPISSVTLDNASSNAGISIPFSTTDITPSSSSSAVPLNSDSFSNRKKELDEVDLSFAKLDGKPLKFVKRAMGEARRLLCGSGLDEAKTSGYEFILADKENLSKWIVKLRDLNPDGQLSKELAQHKLEPCIDLELSLPNGFPMEPPFARVLYPQLSGGFVFQHGGICFEPLTTKGWVPSMTLPALAIAIKGIMDFGDVRVAGTGNKSLRTIPQYTEQGARQDHSYILSAHRNGESNTYGSMKAYAS